jgi:CRISPR-associated protein Csm2
MPSAPVRPSPQGPQREEIQLPTPQPVHYFTGGNLDPALLDKDAEQWAKKLKQLSSSQLRRFYEHVLGLDRRLNLESQHGDREQAFSRLRAEFKMLKAKAAYAFKRHGAKVPPEFLQFIINHVNAVNTVREFDAFTKHFQAVVAFHKFYAEENN